MLKDILDRFTQEELPKIESRILDLIQYGYRKIIDSDIGKNAVAVGELAPDFTLPNQRGEHVNLLACLESHRIALVFYRGHWCPYCNLTLRHYQDHLERFNEAGVTLIAVSVESVTQRAQTINENRIEFQVLTDDKGVVAANYGLLFEVPQEHIDALKLLGNDLDKINSNLENQLPVAATYLIDQDRTVLWRHVENNYRSRAEVDEILSNLHNARRLK